MAYTLYMGIESLRIVSFPRFEKRIYELLDDDDLEYWEIQEEVAAHPLKGNLIPGGKGLRKLRWGQKGRGKGKSGGIRLIYYYLLESALVFSDAFPKGEKEDLSSAELAERVAELEEWKHENSA